MRRRVVGRRRGTGWIERADDPALNNRWRPCVATRYFTGDPRCQRLFGESVRAVEPTPNTLHPLTDEYTSIMRSQRPVATVSPAPDWCRDCTAQPAPSTRWPRSRSGRAGETGPHSGRAFRIAVGSRLTGAIPARGCQTLSRRTLRDGREGRHRHHETGIGLVASPERRLYGGTRPDPLRRSGRGRIDRTIRPFLPSVRRDCRIP